VNKLLSRTFAILLLIFLPTQLSYHFWPAWSYVFGFRIDFMAPTLYLTDMFSLIVIVLNFKIYRKFIKILALIFLLAIINCLFSVSLFESIYKWIKIFEVFLIGLYFSKQKILKTTTVFKTILYSSIPVSVLGILQFFLGSTLGGIFYWLGERHFNLNTPGIALVSILGSDHLRSYSTFSHPNSLAGFLGVVLIGFMFGNKVFSKKIYLLNLTPLLICFLLTFSLSSILGFFVISILSLVIYKRYIAKFFIILLINTYPLLSLIYMFVSERLLNIHPYITKNISERLDLNIIALKIISNNFFTGVGLGNFITSTIKYTGIYTYSWLLQPVHNGYILIFSELGIVGVLFFYFFLNKLLNRNFIYKNFKFLFIFTFILLTGFTDHYWLTLQQNIMLCSIFAGLSFNITSWKKN
jgi:hypothetical protein